MIRSISRSLEDLLGSAYVEGVIRARAVLTGEDECALWKIAREKVDFCPELFRVRQERLMEKTGTQVCPPADDTVRLVTGAPTDSFSAAQHQSFAPMSASGCFRIGEDGRMYFAGKSEHYHIPLGHDFPGYALIEQAKRLGIPNATHNNTRGYITRLCEQELVAAANNTKVGTQEYAAALASREPGVLNRVINLETGSLVCEAALKMMLSRFYTIEGKPAEYDERIPVFLVMGDNEGGVTAGYHGTTFFAQMLRGLWPTFADKAKRLFRVESVAINDMDAFADAIERWNTPPYKTAGFCHEIIMMNYSGIRLDERFLRSAYALCRRSDTPVLCDEIQSGAWYDTFFLFRKYGISPDFLTIGKGFPGGCYAASKILVSGAYDTLNQFGALVTNGQEELASLAYLITMEFIRANAAHIDSVGRRYHDSLKLLAAEFPEYCCGVKGDAHMSALYFRSAEEVVRFCSRMNNVHCIDISAQTYKANCLPVALTKLPLLVTESMTDVLIARMRESLHALSQNG